MPRIRRVCRIFFYCAAAFSLLLCIVSAAIWVRSRWIGDHVIWKTAGGANGLYNVTSCVGGFLWEHCDMEQTPPRGSEFEYLVEKAEELDMESGHGDSWYGFVYNRLGDTGRWHPTGINGEWYRLRYYWGVPYWFVVLLTVPLPAVAAYRIRRRKRARLAGHCPACGYDCRATPDRCPECGAVQQKQTA